MFTVFWFTVEDLSNISAQMKDVKTYVLALEQNLQY